MLQLNPPIPVIAKGQKGLAHILIDYGVEHDLTWVVFLENGECWCIPNGQVRAQENWTFGRPPADLSVAASMQAYFAKKAAQASQGGSVP